MTRTQIAAALAAAARRATTPGAIEAFLLLAGVASVFAGLALIYLPVALIVLGAGAIAAALQLARSAEA